MLTTLLALLSFRLLTYAKFSILTQQDCLYQILFEENRIQLPEVKYRHFVTIKHHKKDWWMEQLQKKFDHKNCQRTMKEIYQTRLAEKREKLRQR